MSIEEKIKTAKEDSWLKDSVSEKEFKKIKDNERRMTRKEIIDGLKFTVEMFINPITGEEYKESIDEDEKIAIEACKGAIELLEQARWIPVSEKLPDYGVAVLTYDGSCYSVEKRIPTIRDDDGEPISGEWWVSDDYDESNSEYYPNLRDGACIAWMPLPEPYEADKEEK